MTKIMANGSCTPAGGDYIRSYLGTVRGGSTMASCTRIIFLVNAIDCDDMIAAAEGISVATSAPTKSNRSIRSSTR